MRNRSIAKNTLIYTIRVLSSMLFPLITFPYISRVLSPAGVGKYSFSASVISYFSLLAALGISTYAIREGAKVRDNRDKLEKLAQEFFTINICSTTISYLLFLIILFFVPKLIEYRELLIILSVALPLSTIGTEWIFSIYEDYVYITIRSVAFQFVSVILMFLLVRNQNDVNTYAMITVFSNVGSNVFNYIKAERYFKHKLAFRKDLINHLKPILILFASAIASQIYVNLDTTMLGFSKNNTDVGIYTAATKIYNIVRSLLTAFITVVTPRLTYYYAKCNVHSEYKVLFNKSLKGYIALIIPAGIGMLLISRQSILILSGKNYLLACNSLKILSIALIFSTSGSFIANAVLIITGQEKKILLATIMGATINFVLNLIFIPLYSYTGTAVTTLISEIIVFGIQLFFSKQVVSIRKYVIAIIKPMIACIPMIIFTFIISLFDLNYILVLLTIVIFAILSYLIILVLLKHEIILMGIQVLQKWRR